MTRRKVLQRLTQAPAAVMVPTAFTKDQSFAISYGRVTFSDHELADGCFAIGQDTAVICHPNSSGWLRLKELKDKAVTLILRVDE